MTSTAVRPSVTSWWYGQGRAVDVARHLESLYSLSPPPGPAGLIAARRDELTVTFVAALKAPLPYPWRSAESNNEACIAWDAVNTGLAPDPDRPVYLVVFGTTDDGALIGLNLAAFQRIRIEGDPAVAAALVGRWVLELLTSHPHITIGVTADVWRGPLTTRVKPVAVGRVPQVDVLVCGPDLTYTDRAQIVSNASSKIMVDLGADAAVDTKWTITCGPDRLGAISNGVTRPMSATLILPSPATIERCCDLLTEPAGQPAAPRHAAASPGGEAPHGLLDTDDASDTDPQMPALTSTLTLQHTVEATSADGAGIDFFATPAAAVPDGLDDEAASWPGTDSQSGGTDSSRATEEPAVAPSTSASVPAGDDPSYEGLDGAVPEIMPIWNRILGQLDLCPPHSTQQRGPREKRLNELTVFLQHNRFVDADEIIRNVFGGAASEKTVTQQVSMLRARLGVVHAGGPKALPPMRDGSYVLDGAVRSDWMEFERLVEILIDTTPTAHLIAAMDLVTGPPLGGVPPKEWAWTKDIRDEIRDRVAGAAVVLARRHHSAKKFSDAAEIARKGLWYDNARQDLWQIGMQAALDGHDKNGFKTLRSQYLSAVAGPDRDPAVFDLTKHAG